MVAKAKPVPQYKYPITSAVGGDRFQQPVHFGADIAGSYRAEKLDNGNYAIRNVDIFRATTRTNPATGASDIFDGAWLRGAVQRFEERKVSDQYLPPVHIGHNGPGKQTKFAGHLDNLRLKDGDVPVLYADIVEIPPQVFAEIAARRIPYRSIEINKPTETEVSSLALLDTQVPYHKMRLLRVDVPEMAAFGDDVERPLHFAGRDTDGHYVIGQPFERGYAAIDRPTRLAQRFGNYQRQMFGPGEDGGEDYDDDYPDEMGEGEEAIDLSDEELAELMASLEGGDGYDDATGYEDDEDLAELQELGIQEDEMSEIKGLLQQMVQELGSLKETVNASGATGKPQPPAAVPMGESEASKVAFSENGGSVNSSNGSKPKEASQTAFSALQARVADIESKLDYVVQFAEEQHAREEQEAVHGFIAQCFQEAEAKAAEENGDLTDKARLMAWKAVSNDVNDMLSRQQFGENDDPAAFIEEAVKQSFGEWSASFHEGRPATPRPPRWDGREQPGRAAAAESEVVRFCESKGLGHFFEEDKAGTIRKFGELAEEWDKRASKQGLYTNRDEFIAAQLRMGGVA